MQSRPRILNGVFGFAGSGLGQPKPLSPALVYRVPRDRRAQAIYFRAGNATGELVCFTVMRDGAVLRLFPVGARASVHVPLAVLEDLEPDSVIEVLVAAPDGVAGQAVVDFGLMEI